MAFQRNAGFTSAIATNPADTAAGYLTPARYNLPSVVSGATVGGIAYFPTATSEAMSGRTWNASGAAGEGLAIAAGTATTAVSAFSATQTWNNAAVTFTGYSYSITDQAANAGSAAASIHSQWLGGTAGATNLMKLSKGSVLTLDSSAGGVAISYSGIIQPGGVGFTIQSANNIILLNSNGGLSALQVGSAGVAGFGTLITAGTATTDVAALSVTRTNNNAAVATGVKFAFTDTTSAAGFLPFQVLAGAAATTNVFSLGKTGLPTLGAGAFTANGSTLWAVGSNCPGNATVQEWLTVVDSGGNTRYIPCF